MATLEEQFKTRVNAFLKRTGLSPTTLGMKAVGDPSLLRQMGAGRSPSLRTADRVLAFMAAFDTGQGSARDPPRRVGRRKRSARVGRTRSSGPTTGGSMGRITNPPTRILRLPEVQARTGLSRSTIHRWRNRGRFPRAIPLGARSVGWIESEVEAWIRGRIEERRGGRSAAANRQLNSKEENK